MSEYPEVLTSADLKQAEEGSYFTLAGCGGDLMEWVNGIEEMLAEDGIGKPVKWYSTFGDAVNNYIRPVREQDNFPGDVTLLMFPLDGLNVGKLAIFRLTKTDARWFDDIVMNCRRS